MGRLQEVAKQNPEDIFIDCEHDIYESYTIFEYLRKTGKLTYPETCQECGLPQKRGKGGMHMHHPDYHYPGRVEFLCPKCHRNRHQHPQKGKVRLPEDIMLIRQIMGL